MKKTFLFLVMLVAAIFVGAGTILIDVETLKVSKSSYGTLLQWEPVYCPNGAVECVDDFGIFNDNCPVKGYEIWIDTDPEMKKPEKYNTTSLWWFHSGSLDDSENYHYWIFGICTILYHKIKK